MTIAYVQTGSNAGRYSLQEHGGGGNLAPGVVVTVTPMIMW